MALTLAEAEQEIAQLRAELKDCRAQAEQKVHALKRELVGVRVDAAKLVQAAERSAQQATDSAAAKIAEVEAGLDDAFVKLAESMEAGPVGRRIAEAEKKAAGARQQLQETTADLRARLERERVAARARIATLTSGLQALRVEVAQLQQAPAALREELADAHARIERLQVKPEPKPTLRRLPGWQRALVADVQNYGPPRTVEELRERARQYERLADHYERLTDHHEQRQAAEVAG